MTFYLHRACLVSTLVLLLSGCAQLPDVDSLIKEAEEVLPLAPIGGIPVQVVAEVEFDNRETAEGMELTASSGRWTHTQEGRLMSTLGWQPHLDRIDGAQGGGRLHCYYDWGQADPRTTPHWTVQWSSELSFDDAGTGSASPLIDLATYDNEVLVLYAPPREFRYWHPGSPDDCQNPDPVPAHEATGDIWFHLNDVDVERPPDADTSSRTVVQEGIVLLRIPLERLRSGTSETNSVRFGATDKGTYGTIEWSLSITLTLTAPPDKD
ncbi:MAG: hypothetical protein ACLFV5_05530 [Anaerolineales bacterium]